MKVRIAAVQTKLYEETGCQKLNMQQALEHIDNAVMNEAQIVYFPETYPGPWKESLDFCPRGELAEKAKERSVYVIYGTVERAKGYEDRHRIGEVLIGPKGKTVGKYMRTSPPGPWIYKNSR